jgi:hypothetical protein
MEIEFREMYNFRFYFVEYEYQHGDNKKNIFSFRFNEYV